jgi:hypothetical protein
VERLHSASANYPSNSFRGGVHGSIDRCLDVLMPTFDDDAWQRTQHNLDTASLIRAPSRPVVVGNSD